MINMLCARSCWHWLFRQLLSFVTLELIISTREIFIASTLISRPIQLILIGYFFIDEKRRRHKFLQEYIQKQKPKDWQLLVDQIIPNSILIAKPNQRKIDTNPRPTVVEIDSSQIKATEEQNKHRPAPDDKFDVSYVNQSFLNVIGINPSSNNSQQQK